MIPNISNTLAIRDHEVKETLTKMFTLEHEKPILVALHIIGLVLLNLISVVVIAIIFGIHCKITAAGKAIDNDYYNQSKIDLETIRENTKVFFTENEVDLSGSVKIATNKTKSGKDVIECSQVKIGEIILLEENGKHYPFVVFGFDYIYEPDQKIHKIIVYNKVEEMSEYKSILLENVYLLPKKVNDDLDKFIQDKKDQTKSDVISS